MKCPNCEKEVSPEWKRCPYCEYKPQICSKQGCQSGWLPAVAHFCPLCGSPVKGEENLRLKEIIEKTIANVSPSEQSDYTSLSSGSNDMDIVVGNVSFKMIRVEGGSFQMGCDDYEDEKPVHRVMLGDYYIGETVVTQALWNAVMGSQKGCDNLLAEDNLPVEYVSWESCQEFIKHLNKITGKTFRLPTEAEWEYAARGGRKSQGFKYAGSNDIDMVAWYEKNRRGNTRPVKQKVANELGLYDMSGNVWEWCQDWWGRYSSSSQTNPTGPLGGTCRVYRGGSYNYGVHSCRVTCRCGAKPDNCFSNLGFRLVL